MSSDNKIGLGVVGASAKYGWGMRAHMPAILALPEYNLIAVCTTSEETAKASAEKYGSKKYYWDYNKLIADPDVEVVDVCVKAPSHFEVAMAALDAGKHVFCEWPLGSNSEQADKMALLAKQKGVKTIVALQSRYAPSFQNLRNLVRQGYVGEILSANMSMFLPGIMRPRPQRATWNSKKEAGAHALNIATGHALDVFLWSLGELTEVTGVVATQVKEWEVAETGEKLDVTSPDTVAIVGKLAEGGLVSAHISSVPWHGTAFRMEVYGTEGTLVATSDQMVEMVDPVLRGARSDEEMLSIITPPPELLWVPNEVPQGIAVNMAQMFRRFAESVRGGVDAGPDFEEAAKRQHTLGFLEKASAEKSWMKIS